MAVEARKSELRSEVLVVQLSGRLDMEAIEADAPALKIALDDCSAGLILDLQAVTFLSSSGLRMLISVRQNALAAGKQLVITGVSPLVRKTFVVAGLENAFQYCATPEAALASLGNQPERS